MFSETYRKNEPQIEYKSYKIHIGKRIIKHALNTVGNFQA